MVSMSFSISLSPFQQINQTIISAVKKTELKMSSHAPHQTNIGSILAAVNPYKQIPGLYDPAAVDLYSRHHLGELPPHIFAVANECYRCLWKRHDSQCVLIRSVHQGLGDIALTRSYCSHRRLDSNT